MVRDRRRAAQGLLLVLAVTVLAGAVIQRAAFNLNRIDFKNSNFVFFWLAGRMVVDGENPYDSPAWLAAHDTNDIAWRPNEIFPYPLPLAVLLAPLGVTSLGQAYFAWQLVSGLQIMGALWFLARRFEISAAGRLLAVIALGVVSLFFGPVFLTLQIGALGAFTLTAVLITMRALEREKLVLAGLAGALLLLKPPQGLPVLLLLGIWLLAQRKWKALVGLVAGTALLGLAGTLIDPAWLAKFVDAGRAVAERTMGLQSNTFGLAYLACGSAGPCMWWLGGLVSAAVLGFTAIYLWRNAAALQPWDVLSISIPAGFLATLYLWSYDQILYLVPLLWILSRLMQRGKPYIWSAAFLAVVVTVAFGGMLVQAYTRSDMVSLATTVLVLSAVFALRPGGAPARTSVAQTAL